MIKRFFLADDDPDDTDLFSDALSDIDPDTELHSASNGLQLIEKLKESDVSPEVIFLDINMPEMNGWEALKMLKTDGQLKQIPVIMYSTTSSRIDGKRAVEFGALCFYEKPTNFLMLKEFLKYIVSSSQDKLEQTLKNLVASKAHKIYH